MGVRGLFCTPKNCLLPEVFGWGQLAQRFAHPSTEAWPAGGSRARRAALGQAWDQCRPGHVFTAFLTRL